MQKQSENGRENIENRAIVCVCVVSDLNQNSEEEITTRTVAMMTACSAPLSKMHSA
jgi:hypothetical protein